MLTTQCIGDFVFENGLLVRVTTTEAATATEEDVTAGTNVDEELIVFPEDNDFVATTEQTVEDGVLEEVFLGTTETRVEAETVTSPSVDEAKKYYEIKEEEGEYTNEQDASANNTLFDTARRPEVNLTSYHNFSSLVSLLENLDSNYSGIASRYHTIPYHAIANQTIPYSTIPNKTEPYSTIPYHKGHLKIVMFSLIKKHPVFSPVCINRLGRGITPIPYHTLSQHTTP